MSTTTTKAKTINDLFDLIGATVHTRGQNQYYAINNCITVNNEKYMIGGMCDYSDGKQLGKNIKTNKSKIIASIDYLLSGSYTDYVAVDNQGYADDSSCDFNYSHMVAIKNQPHPNTIFLRGLKDGLNT
jgi:hypothetical protein